MTQNPSAEMIQTATLATLASEVSHVSKQLEAGMANVADISKRLASLVKQSKAAASAPVASPAPELHPIAAGILASLTTAGKAVRKTALAKQLNVERSSVHYHCKTKALAPLVYSIETVENGRDVDYVILRSLHKVPGIDS
jgi:hypothetical protein